MEVKALLSLESLKGEWDRKGADPQERVLGSLEASQWGTLISWTLILAECIYYAVGFGPYFFFFFFVLVLSPSWQPFRPFVCPVACFNPVTGVASPQVKLPMEFSRGRCLLRRWSQWSRIDCSLIHIWHLEKPGFNKKLFGVRRKNKRRTQIHKEEADTLESSS